MQNADFKERLKPLYASVVKNASIKIAKHKAKGDWRTRSDKTVTALTSGLIIEVGEFVKEIEGGCIEKLLAEAGDIINYLTIIIDEIEYERSENEKRF